MRKYIPFLNIHSRLAFEPGEGAGGLLAGRPETLASLLQRTYFSLHVDHVGSILVVLS
jgi:hypothetical protein